MVLAIVLFALQIRVFSSEGGIAELLYMKDKVAEVENNLREQKELNAELEQTVYYLKSEPLATESIARQTLGLVKESESFYMIVEETPNPQSGSENNSD